MKRLSARLQAIAEMVEPGSYLADVGSDHALLPIHLVESGKISWAMAIENKIGPYLHMTQAIDEAGLQRVMAERPDLRYVADVRPDCADALAADCPGRVFFTPKKMGAQTAIPTRAEAEAFIAQ